MELIWFTKFLRGLSPQQIGEVAQELGFDGLDLAVRAGQAVNPANVTQALPAAMAIWRDLGLSVPLVTLEGDAVDPGQPETQAIFAACGEAGVPCIKLGYWRWRPGQPYWEGVGAVRAALAGFEELGRRHHVCSLVHTHSGACYGLNASAAMQLVQGFDPAHVGIYLDPAHLALDGEPLAMALDIAGDYLKRVAAKNVRYLPAEPVQQARWRKEWCLLAEGLVDWPEGLRLLSQAGYHGPLSVHGEYSASEETEEVVRLVAEDMKYLRGLVP